MKKSWVRTTALALAALGAAVVAALPAGAASPAPNPIVNGSFETGDLTGWTATLSGGSAAVVPGGVDGSWFAAISGGDADVYQIVSQTIPRLGGGSGGVNRLKGWARYDANDTPCVFFDDAQVIVDRIVAGFVVSSTQVFYGDTCIGDTDWVQWSYAIPGQGAYRIRARVRNTSDSIAASSLHIDAHTYQGSGLVTGP